MQIIILIIQVLVALAIIALVLVQQGKGSDIGAAFGSGASNTMFGSAGSTSFLMKVTMVLAAIFFACCLALNYYAAHAAKAQPKDILGLPTSTSSMSLPVDHTKYTTSLNSHMYKKVRQAIIPHNSSAKTTTKQATK